MFKDTNNVLANLVRGRGDRYVGVPTVAVHTEPRSKRHVEKPLVTAVAKVALAAIAVKGAALLIAICKELSAEVPIVIKSGQIEVHLLRTGASIRRIYVPDRAGHADDIVLGHRSTNDYKVDPAKTYFGCVVGRVANRIENAECSVAADAYVREVCRLEANDGPHALHGGREHWGRQQWAVERVEVGPTRSIVRFARESPAFEGGYPGTVAATVTYSLESNPAGGGALACVMEADTDSVTPVNMVQHSYFNLAGHRLVKQGALITEHTAEIRGRFVTPTRPDLIPTGELLPVEGTPYDFTQPAFIGEKMQLLGGGFDTNWVLHEDGIEAVRSKCSEPAGMMKETRVAAEVFEPASGRGLEISTNAPGLQFYTGNFLDDNRGKDGAVYKRHSGFCVETQTFPNSVNIAHFPSPVLHPREHYRHEMVMRFFVN